MCGVERRVVGGADLAQPPHRRPMPGFKMSPDSYMDALSEILKSMTMRHAAVGTLSLSDPWGLSVPDFGAPVAYGVVSGQPCWLRVPCCEAICLGVGDMVLIRGAHQLLSSATAPAEDFGLAWSARGFTAFAPGLEPAGPLHFEWGGGGAPTRLLGLAFGLSGGPDSPLLSALPPSIVLRRGDGFPWIGPAIEFLTSRDSESAGYAATARLLAELTFVSMVRSHLLSQSGHISGWLRGLTDARIGRALQAVHQSPGEDWTVASLARLAGMSRTGFARLFAELVETTPIDYLTRWRMHLAAQRLSAAGETNLTQLAFELGYSSDAAFRDAFKRQHGVAPSRFSAGGLQQQADSAVKPLAVVEQRRTVVAIKD
jgi:AraC-like DNA-binding protein